MVIVPYMITIVDWYFDGLSAKINYVSFLSNSMTCIITITAFYLLSLLHLSLIITAIISYYYFIYLLSWLHLTNCHFLSARRILCTIISYFFHSRSFFTFIISFIEILFHLYTFFSLRSYFISIIFFIELIRISPRYI